MDIGKLIRKKMRAGRVRKGGRIGVERQREIRRGEVEQTGGERRKKNEEREARRREERRDGWGGDK